ncbi:hypothetical protein EI94DRAFT_1271386 [Lactarius quietus]|nr:hypothetical protein EI94DRAFT_1271386 [Lactarius quietus]
MIYSITFHQDEAPHESFNLISSYQYRIFNLKLNRCHHHSPHNLSRRLKHRNCRSIRSARHPIKAILSTYFCRKRSPDDCSKSTALPMGAPDQPVKPSRLYHYRKWPSTRSGRYAPLPRVERYVNDLQSRSFRCRSRHLWQQHTTKALYHQKHQAHSIQQSNLVSSKNDWRRLPRGIST